MLEIIDLLRMHDADGTLRSARERQEVRRFQRFVISSSIVMTTIITILVWGICALIIAG